MSFVVVSSAAKYVFAPSQSIAIMLLSRMMDPVGVIQIARLRLKPYGKSG